MSLLRLFLAPTPITNTQHSGKETIVPPSHNSGVLEQSRGSESQKNAVKRPESIRIKTAAYMFNPSRQTQTTHRSYYIQNGTFTPCIDKFSDKQSAHQTLQPLHALIGHPPLGTSDAKCHLKPSCHASPTTCSALLAMRDNPLMKTMKQCEIAEWQEQD